MISLKKCKLIAQRVSLTALILLISSCAGLGPFPARELVEINIQKGICREYALVDEEKVIYKFIKEYTIEECPPVFGIKVDKAGLTTQWARDAIKIGKECKNGR